MEVDSESEVEIADLVGDVIRASKIPAKRRGIPIRPTVDKLCSAVYEHGLLPEPLNDLIGLLVKPSHLDQASLGALVRNLYPVAAVSADAVLDVVGCLGIGELKPSLNIQAALLRWLVMVYHVIDNPAILSRAYPVLFNLLDVAATRPQLCHVLALITRRKHVQPFRIQAVLALSRQTGKDPSVVGLLRVFKDYYPEIIVGDAVRGKASAFKHPDIQWRLHLDEIQESHSRRMQANAALSRQSGFQVRHKSFGRPGRSAIPAVHSSHATEQSVTLEEIDNATSFVKNIENIMLPSQLVAVIADPLLQKLLLLRPDEEAYSRVNNWMVAVLQDIRSGEADAHTISDVLGLLHEYVVVSKKLPPLILNFFVDFLKVWNGRDGREAILGLLPYAPLLEFDKLYENIFRPLEAGVLDSSPESQLAMLDFYKNLLRHWNVQLLASDQIPSHATTSVPALVNHAQRLALTLTQTNPTVATQLAIVSFLEENASLLSDERLRQNIRIAIPPPTLVYSLFFSSSLAVLSRLCAILSAYKQGFQAAMAVKVSRRAGAPAVNSSTYDAEYVNLFNGFLMDICNCIWRMRAFTNADPNARACLVSRRRVRLFEGYVGSLDSDIVSLPLLFGLSHSPVLSLQSVLALRDLEDEALERSESSLEARHPGPVTQGSLVRLREQGGLVVSWQDYRISVLQRLEGLGFVGIPDLMRNTMKILRGPERNESVVSGGSVGGVEV
ncbi:related to Mis6 domain protein [Cephalotrichum gorgonifer]|uniref:Related to Mis6 domain protein n=1 Tax=Cephalotrichum gorgonifer TaxID=2041049 RepID=A0AAE8MTR5_9PEZI|nr:related to Mis6 domain protein [Cephalotrichum gorgonifer]